jgi:ADP-dependent NAD(P)H-hydrate dehydratase / NAD(P)H-hydrate epimerase
VIMRAYRVDKIRRIEDRAIAVEGVDALMQRAAAAVAASAFNVLQSTSGGQYGRHVMIMVGAGNNGGDALFAGVRLVRRGVRVTAIRCLGAPHPSGVAALLAAGGRVLDLDDHYAIEPMPYHLVIDGILGIGGRPGLPDPVAHLVRSVAAQGIPTIAVDLPSGVAADTGAVPGAAVQATETVTFGELKPCHLLQPALRRCGSISVVDIGLGTDHDETADLAGLDEDDLSRAWPYPTERSDKYARGVVGVDTGSDQYPGAAVMSVYGAVYGGAGYVRYLGAERPAATISAQLPNVVFSPGRVQAHLFGSGWGERADGAKVLAAVAEEGLPAVVDADGLGYLPKPAPASWLLTPHAGELARLLERERSWVEQDPVRAVTTGAQQTGATVLLKGASQLVATPLGGPVLVAVPGPAWTAQAGSGDVLGGVCAALLAAGVDAQRAGQLGASVQAVAAAEQPGVLAPQELARAIGQTLGRLEQRARAR